MPSFDVVSEVDLQEVRNAVDQASRELTTRFDFKGTDSSIGFVEKNHQIDLESASEERLKAVIVVLEEKFVKRKLSLKTLDYGKIEAASGERVRQHVKLTMGISSDKAKEIGKFLKGLPIKGISHSNQGDSLRVTGKKRDDLQGTIAALREQDFDIPLQFENFRD